MSMIEAVFLDIDGTLVSPKTHQISPALIKALVEIRKKGIKLFIATGRHVSEMKEILREDLFDGYITLNGCYCFNEKGPYYKETICQKDADTAIELASRMEHCLVFVEEDAMYTNFQNSLMMDVTSELNLPVPAVVNPETLRGKDIYMLMLYTTPQEDEQILSQMPTLSAVRWHNAFVDVTPRHISKKKGLIKTCEFYNFQLENCMAFGDAGNDIEMLQTAGHGIAMGNASEDVKLAADEVTLSVDEDGIVHTLKKYNLLENV